ncbi:cytochrome P450 2J4-like [Podarcis raffonei]|uniref:cytochrome P450 2J4-like n=1 Tax=Podarcis raffonei TaxID=65483 RepID=UPI0023295F55|nr:cytochrome P450 2J4-like [Podarcis raffonei]
MRNLGLRKKGMEFQIQEEAHRLVEVFACAKVSSLICVLAFGYRFSLEDEKFQKLIDAIDCILKDSNNLLHMLYEVFPWLMKHFPGPHRKLFASADLVLSFAKEELERHKEQRKDEPQDFIDFYLLQMEKSKDDPNPTFDEDNLAECVLDLFIAGTEMTAATLQWALLLMVSYPDVQDKIYKEMEDVLGSSLPICYEDRKKLPYTNAVMHEILCAKYPLLVGIPRLNAKDLEMHGFHVPKGAFVAPDLNSVLVDPTRWKNLKSSTQATFWTRMEILGLEKNFCHLKQNVMDSHLKGTPGATPFFHDLLIAGPTPEELGNCLRTVLHRFRTTGLKVKQEKCLLGVPQVDFLGFAVDAEGVHLTSDKVWAIYDDPAPKGKTELQAFLGLLNFYLTFLPHKAAVAEPLHRLLDKWSIFLTRYQYALIHHPGKGLAMQTPSAAYHYQKQALTQRPRKRL